MQSPNSTENLKSFSHMQVLQLVSEKIYSGNPEAVNAIKKVFDEKINDYPLNASDGHHLCNTIEAYHNNLQSRGTIETGIHKMIANLMDEQKVTSKSVAESIANWLYHSYIVQPKQQAKEMDELVWNELKPIKNEIDEKVRRMRETKLSIPNTLYDEKSEIRVRFRQDSLVASICFGPTLPPNKYDEYSMFLKKESKEFVIYVYNNN